MALLKDDKDFIVGLLVFFMVASILNFFMSIALVPAVVIALIIAIPSAFIFDKLSS